ncbi:MAG: SRPBCC domain-containing protein [Cyclobacteriaceae bacterium]|nr:SRPBCC domain-containing protein [Cyclobacteriaceae bacterium]
MAGKSEFIISRVFNAPRELVFQAFTQAEHLKHWWGPKGVSIKIYTLEVKPGGIFHYSMTHPDGSVVWGRFTFQEIVAPERLSFLNAFSDEKGNIAPAPFDTAFPKQVLNEWTFAELNGKTTVTLKATAFNASAESQKCFENLFSSMTGGYGGMFDVFENYLTTLK